jgi:hypothetical protein
MWFILALIPKAPKAPKAPAALKGYKKLYDQIISSPYTLWILYALGAFAIFWLIRFVVRRRRKNNPQVVSLTAKELLLSWKGFLKAIPADFRRTIAYYKPFIVMGGGSTGKSQLIDKYTDWKGMARQFYPSYNRNSKIQFHLGTQSLIQEISLPILEDSSKGARRALKKLWASTFKKSAPTVILTLPINKLANSSAEILKKQAQLLRGKINVLAWQRKTSVQTKIALTHMDSIVGYEQFCQLLTANNIHFELQLQDYSSDSLSQALAPYEKYLSLALTTLPAKDYLKLIAFFKEAPKQLAHLQTFINALTMAEPLSPEPELTGLLFTSSLENDKISSPFEVSAVDCILKRWSYHKHQVAAIAIFGFILAYGVLGYSLEKKRLNSIEAHLNEFDDRLTEDNANITILDEQFDHLDIKSNYFETVLFPEQLSKEDKHLKKDLKPFLEKERSQLNQFPELDYFPPFFTKRTKELHTHLNKEAEALDNYIVKTDKLIAALKIKQAQWNEYERAQRVDAYREKILLPLFKLFNQADDKYIEVTYALFALYARKGNGSENTRTQGKNSNMLYSRIIQNPKKWINRLQLDTRDQKALLNGYMFSKFTDGYTFNDYLYEAKEYWGKTLILDSSNVLFTAEDGVEGDIVVEFYELIKKFIESHDYISRTDLHLFRKKDKELTKFKRLLDTKREWLDLDAIFIKQKTNLKTAALANIGDPDYVGDQLPTLPHEWILDVTEREELNQDGYADFLEEVNETNLDIDSNIGTKTFQEFISVLHKYKDVVKQDSLTFKLQGKKAEFDLNKWRKMIIHSKLQLTIEAFAKAASTRGSEIFFDANNDHDNYDDIELTQLTNGSFLFSGKSKIDGKYTKEAFENTIVPAINEFLEFEKALDGKVTVSAKETGDDKMGNYKIKTSTRRILENLVRNALEDYATKYNASMQRFASAMKITSGSEADLKYILQQIQKKSSTFGIFLQKLKENTTLTLDHEIYQPMIDKLKEFKYIATIMREEKGYLPELDQYFGILQVMEKELNGSADPGLAALLPPDSKMPEKNTAGKSGLPQLDKQLSPLGNMTLSIFRQQSSSYYLRIKKWLDAVKIPQKYQAPFLEPAISAYRLGAVELQSQIQHNWDILLQKILQPMNSYFPFSPKSQKSISPDEVTSLLGVQGSFWQYYESMLGAATELRNGKWHKTSITRVIKLPPSMLPTLNRLQNLKDTLWNNKGQNQTITVKANAGLLPDAGVIYHIFDSLPVLAYLNAGSTSVLAFNQKPQWQDIKLEWWRPHVASIGVQFRTLSSNEAVFSTINTDERDWALLRLLAEGAETSDSSWVWNINVDAAMQSINHNDFARLTSNGPMAKLPVRFRFKESLSDIFKLDLSWSAREKIDQNMRKPHIPTWSTLQPGSVQNLSQANRANVEDHIDDIFGLTPPKAPLKLPELKEDISKPQDLEKGL